MSRSEKCAKKSAAFAVEQEMRSKDQRTINTGAQILLLFKPEGHYENNSPHSIWELCSNGAQPVEILDIRPRGTGTWAKIDELLF